MNFKKIFAFKTNFKYIAWILWVVFLANSLTYFSAPFLESTEKHQSAEYLKLFIIILVGIALIESGVTILIRHFAIIRPYKKGSYSPYQGPFRFLMVGLINWIFAESVVIYGTVVFLMSGRIWPVWFFGCLGIALLIYHSPRLGCFSPTTAMGSDIVDATFTQIK